MNREPVAIKGTRDGLAIILYKNTEFEKAKNAIYEKLKKSGEFFKGAKARVFIKEGVLEKKELEDLEKLLNDFGISLKKEAFLKAMPLPTHFTTTTLYLKKTIRSGQRISYGGNIVILGDVNPGSEVLAGGDIIVLGALRGLAHAGYKGNRAAIVAANKLLPTQLRIADVIARPPDEKHESSRVPEIARLKEDTIIIEPYYNILENNKPKQEGNKWVR
ncbi:septum site-determining protein MinC [Thermovenabulum gondwanense]|uniref:Probable septum site-determining protein MinC n=1 Tax=Thermovenabulum gondwanense TaxID=520767 RepID=A0A161PTD9_9FIRM|nr:septum site-determining protein MinC [Thermovenabulum gondwanense]KYO64773.1 Septum site-determining protein MinC [Thermovenabulum gondwanense]